MLLDEDEGYESKSSFDCDYVKIPLTETLADNPTKGLKGIVKKAETISSKGIVKNYDKNFQIYCQGFIQDSRIGRNNQEL